MRFFVYVNRLYPETVRLAEKLKRSILDSGSELTDGTDADVCLVVGGDGTVLRAVREIGVHCPPIWAVNGGHLGYLKESEPENAEMDLKKLTEGRFRLEERIVLRVSIENDAGVRNCFALNEAVIHRGTCMHSLRMELEVDGRSIVRLSGDGMIVSTPTGSTAYNLSAGGPILMPASDELAITPICAHSALCVPMVVPGKSSVVIRAGLDTECEPFVPQLVIDGLEAFEIRENDLVRCTRNDEVIRFVRLGDDSFYKRLQQKLGRNAAL